MISTYRAFVQALSSLAAFFVFVSLVFLPIYLLWYNNVVFFVYLQLGTFSFQLDLLANAFG